MSAASRERLERLLGGPQLRALRLRLRRRFELGATGDVFTLGRLAGPEREALERLLGRRLRAGASMTVSLAELDGALARAAVAASLRDALELLDGPIRERAAQRAAALAEWAQVCAAADGARLAAFLSDAGNRGLLKRLAGADAGLGAALVAQAGRVLSRLPADGVPLAHLAAQATGDSHALDEGRPLATLVLAALRIEGEERPRDTWSRLGVLPGELSAPALAFNLRAPRGTAIGALLDAAHEAAQPLHLSLRMLARHACGWEHADMTVFVCENPSVVAMAADRLGRSCAPLVCTDGMPAAAQRTLLAQLQAAGARLAYHGDFDWGGVRIGNLVMRRFAARPWRFGAADYRPEGGFPLRGEPVAAEWDEQLAPAMAAARLGQHEETVIELLLGDLGT